VPGNGADEKGQGLVGERVLAQIARRALFVPGVREAGVAGDTLAALYNPQLGAWWHAPAAAEIEQKTLAFFRARAGLPESAFGCFTTGGSEANLTGVVAALAARFPRRLWFVR
jgi:glutamate/tyrosine decarboxylase-like PLP-dependent enzyme